MAQAVAGRYGFAFGSGGPPRFGAIAARGINLFLRTHATWLSHEQETVRAEDGRGSAKTLAEINFESL